METGARAAPGAAEQRPACTCDKKPCACQKTEVNYAFLHSTGNEAPGPLCIPKTNPKTTAARSGNCLCPRCGEPRGPTVSGGGSAAHRALSLRRSLSPPIQNTAFLKPAKKRNKNQPKKTQLDTDKKITKGEKAQKSRQQLKPGVLKAAGCCF